MTTATRQAEADRVEIVYHYALARLGAQIISEGTELWHQEVPASSAAATNTRYLSLILRLVMMRRSQAQSLALAYYRLVRALRTGATIQDPRHETTKAVSLERLRVEFEDVVDEIAPHAPAAHETDTTTSEPSQAAETPAPPSLDTSPGVTDDEQIPVEHHADLETIADRLEREAEAEAAYIIDKLGVENMLKKLDKIDPEQTATVVDEQRVEAHRQAGARGAAEAERITMNAARGLAYNLADTDQRVMGWVRFSRTGTPCGWCAMLISRGAVYKTKKAANLQGETSQFEQFHTNCHCIAVPVFSDAQYDRSDLFALNRQYDHLWQNGDEAKGLPANPSLSAWRAYFRQHMQDQQETQTQAAA